MRIADSVHAQVSTVMRASNATKTSATAFQMGAFGIVNGLARSTTMRGSVAPGVT